MRKITLAEQADRLFADQASQKALYAHPEVTILTGTEISRIEVIGVFITPGILFLDNRFC